MELRGAGIPGQQGTAVMLGVAGCTCFKTLPAAIHPTLANGAAGWSLGGMLDALPMDVLHADISMSRC